MRIARSQLRTSQPFSSAFRCIPEIDGQQKSAMHTPPFNGGVYVHG